MKPQFPGEANPGELERLLSALCDGELSNSGLVRLEELLENDANCRRMYLEYMDMHARLLLHPDVGSTTATAVQSGCTTVQTAAEFKVQCAPDPVRRTAPQVRLATLFRYAAVAGGTLAASILFQLLWLNPAVPVLQTVGPTVTQPLVYAGPFVATLAQTADCVWEKSPPLGNTGGRLRAGELTLQKGVARIRFDSGPAMVLEGPANIRLDSRKEATVLHGKVVVRADETASPFDLHTPSSTLVDLGAEYAVEVGKTGEEQVHVFDGEVQRTPMPGTLGGTAEHLTAGEARSYGPVPESPGRPTPFDPARFVRELSPSSGKGEGLAGDLLAYEGFDYDNPHLLRIGDANGGSGWLSPWMPGFARPTIKNDFNVLALNVTGSLYRPGFEALSLGGSFDYAGFSKYHRRLATPVRLDEDGVYFLSFLFRREGRAPDTASSLAILFRATDEIPPDKWDQRKRLNIGVGGNSYLFTHLSGVSTNIPIPLQKGETYLLVAKIVASASNPDQVFMRVYGAEEPVELVESENWTVVGPQFESALVFDWLEIHLNSKIRQTIDEIRLGTTWSSVTAPWISVAKGNR